MDGKKGLNDYNGGKKGVKDYNGGKKMVKRIIMEATRVK